MTIDRQFVFIGGLHRSGTSLLHRCIKSHPKVSGFSDTGVPKDEGQHLQGVYEPAKAFGGPGTFGFDNDSFLNESSDLASRENAKKIFSEWRPHWDLDKEVLVEKSPPNVVRTRFLQELFPQSCFIILIRHPIAVSLATEKRRRRYLHSLIDHWLTCHRRFREDRPQLDKCLVLRYERLIDAPSDTLEKVWNFIDLDSYSLDLAIKKGLNQKYFREYKKFKNKSLIRRVYAWFVESKFEKDVQGFGYTLKV